ncbi:MAG: hypothetical protein ACI9EF_002455 [Pseudohongiellaceae bacterium]|jgi:hypothetical protein
MQSRLLPLLSALALCLSATPGAAQSTPATASDADRLTHLEQRLESLSSAYERLLGITLDLENQLKVANGSSDMTEAGDDFFIPRQAAQFAQSGLPGNMGNIYTKPYLTDLGKNTYIGGYIDLEYRDSRGSASSEFDQHRLVPFLYSDVSERVKVAAEVELEHGSEVEVEFAQMDFLIDDGVNLRAGIQLLPLGKLNVVHDSPIQDLTDRPLLNRFIIPTTLRDAGVGVWGNINDEVSYNVVVSNGFRGLDNTGKTTIDNKTGLRNAAPQKDKIGSPFDNNNDKLAVTSRLAYRPTLGVEIGLSAHQDYYDEAANNELNIWALDATVNGAAVPFIPDNVDILFETASADVERDLFAKASGTAGDMTGHYVQSNVHFAPDFLDGWVESGLVEDGAHFTFVSRYGKVDLDDYIMRRTTLGLNFRPNESNSVFKLDFQFNDDSGANKGTNNDDVLLFSFATYF